MKSWKGWLALATALYLIFLIWTVPAGLCWGWWAARPGSGAERVTLVDLRGPWSAGNCAQVKFGPLQLEQLTWQARPLALLRGRLEFALTATGPGPGQATAILNLGHGGLELRDLQWQGPAAPLGAGLLPGLSLTGNLEAQGVRLRLANGLPVEADGQLTWRGAGLALTGPVTLGDLGVTLRTGATGVTATLKDHGGPLRLELQASLKPDGTYEVNGEATPRGKVQPELATLLSLLGPAGADGRLRLARAGRMAPLFSATR